MRPSVLNIALITTVHHNVGDDFVRLGILSLLREAYGEIAPVCIDKHFPVSVRMGWQELRRSKWIRYLERLPKLSPYRLSRLLDLLPQSAGGDVISSADLLVQSGAPVYWCHPGNTCVDNEWYPPLIEKRWMRMDAPPPFLNLGAGSCQSYYGRAEEFKAHPAVLDYIRQLYEQCALTTVRDEVSEELLSSLSLRVKRLPCPSIFARDECRVASGEPEYVVLNYMPAGGHYDFEANINVAKWEREFSEFVRSISRRHRCILVCHDSREEQAAKRLWPDMRRFIGRDADEYLRVYARGKFGIVNRVHAAFAMASFDRPSFVVGSDGRARMTAEVGLESCYVNEASLEVLERAAEKLEANAVAWAVEMREIRQSARAQYIGELRRAATRFRGREYS